MTALQPWTSGPSAMWMFKDNYERVDVERYCLSFEVLKIKAAPVTRLNLFQITLKITKDGKTSDASTHVRERDPKRIKKKTELYCCSVGQFAPPFLHTCHKLSILLNPHLHKRWHRIQSANFCRGSTFQLWPTGLGSKGLREDKRNILQERSWRILDFREVQYSNNLPSTRQRFSEGSQ